MTDLHERVARHGGGSGRKLRATIAETVAPCPSDSSTPPRRRTDIAHFQYVVPSTELCALGRCRRRLAHALFDRLRTGRVQIIGPWSRAELYERSR